jgi:hypothetical protein
MSELHEWMQPSERLVHFYRMPDRSDIRSIIRHIEGSALHAPDPRVLAFYERLRERYLGILPHQRAPVFAGQVARTLSQLLMTEAYLFTLGRGDTSHIRHIVRPLQSQNIRVNVRIMDTTQRSTGAMPKIAGNSREVPS